MLYSPTQFARDQLLTDLMAVRQRLAENWLKGGWVSGEKTCAVAAVQKVTQQQVGGMTINSGTEDTNKVRLGRTLVAIYMALYGPGADRNITMSQVMSAIITFNDGKATHEAVVLLLDRAIAAVHQQVGATVTAGG
jgi:hypothetical protein